MKTKEAKQIAAAWVEENWDRFPGFAGAFFGGSINVTPDDAPWPQDSDVDVFILADTPWSLVHVHHEGLLLEVSTHPTGHFDLSPEAIVADFQYAIHFSVPSIIKDPSGRLQELHKRVRVEYPRKQWVRKRCQGAENRAIEVLDGSLAGYGFENDTAWGALFTLYYAVFAMAEILALADLRNPTIRKAFVVSRHILAQHDRLDIQESLLRTLGAATLTPAQVDAHMQELKVALAQAATVLRQPFAFSDKLQAESRAYTIGGAQQIIDMGHHREAVFWIHFMRAIAQRAMEADWTAAASTRAATGPAPDLAYFQTSYARLLDDLGLRSDEQVAMCAQQARDLLPAIRAVAGVIIDNHPAIRE